MKCNFHLVFLLSDETPAVKTRSFYFERSEKGFRGRPRESIVTTSNKDIHRAKLIGKDFPMQPLKRKEDFENIKSLAQNRKDWRKFSDVICRTAEADIT